MKNQLKIILRNRSLIFWSLVFPLILGTFFFMAFSNITSGEQFKKIDVALVGSSDFKSVLESLDDVFSVVYVDEEKAISLLEDGDIAGYYTGDDLKVVVKNSGTSSTIMKYTLDTYKSYSGVFMDISKIKGTVSTFVSDDTHFSDMSSTKNDPTVIFFYSLIGMVCMLSGAFGINAIFISEANLSKKGARVSVSPKNKLVFLLEALFASLIVQYIEVLIIIGYLTKILGITFANMPYILLISFVGCMAGISLGVFVGVSNKKSEEVKNSLLTGIVMTGSFLSGMMAVDVKFMIEKQMPFLARINPVNMITDGLLSLYYENYDRFFLNFYSLFIFAGVMIVLSFLFIKRRQYESI